MAVDPSKPTTVTIDRETYQVLLDAYTALRDLNDAHYGLRAVRILSAEQIENLPYRKGAK